MTDRSSRPWIVAALGGLALVADAVAFVPATGLHWPDRLVPRSNVHVTQHVLSPPDACPGPLCRNDPVNNFDPVGLETFVDVDNVGKTIALHLLLRYAPEDGAKLGAAELLQLTRRHEKWAEEMFGTYIYRGENAPRDKITERRPKGIDGRRHCVLYDDVAKVVPRYRDYHVRLNVILTTEPEPVDAFFCDPYETIRIHNGDVTWANSRNLGINSTQRTVFHEYMHWLNTEDEYDTTEINAVWNKRLPNFREIFKKAWGKDPEADSIMNSGAGTVVFDRHIEAALFDISNLTRTKRAIDRVFYMDRRDEFFKRRNPEALFRKVQGIIEANP